MSLLRRQSVDTASTVSRPITSQLHLLYKTRAIVTSFSVSSGNIMKKFTLSDDRIVVVNFNPSSTLDFCFRTTV